MTNLHDKYRIAVEKKARKVVEEIIKRKKKIWEKLSSERGMEIKCLAFPLK